VQVEVAYAKPREQQVLTVAIEDGASIMTAILASGILERFPEIELSKISVGIFGKPCGLDTSPRPGDRIEIYRPLIADPMTARRERLQRR
jgi:uncharacterized protein